MPKVLVTGGTGFIAGFCIKQLLEQDYEVITTVRNDDKGQAVINGHAAYSNGKLSYAIVEDVGKEGAFDDVVKSTPKLDYVLHTASPFHYNVQDPVKDFLEPAVIGTTSILKAIKASAPTVKRVVVTSSFAALRNEEQEASADPPTYDESSWNPETWEDAVNDTRKTYRGSKKWAERAAWDFMNTSPPPLFDLVTINPTFVFGPAALHLTPSTSTPLSRTLNTSNQRILQMLTGQMRTALTPTGFYTWCDVRDVATAHIRALEVPAAANQRFFIIKDYFSNREMARIVAGMSETYRARLPDLAAVEDDIPPPGRRYGFDNSRSREVLGLRYCALEECVRDAVESFVALGAEKEVV